MPPVQSSTLSSRPHGCLKADHLARVRLSSSCPPQIWFSPSVLPRIDTTLYSVAQVTFHPLSFPHIQFIAKYSWFDLLINASWICLFLSLPHHPSLSYHQLPPELLKFLLNWSVCIYFDFPPVHFPMGSSVFFSKVYLVLTYFSLGDTFSALHIAYHGGNFTVLGAVLRLLCAFSCSLSALG